MEGIRNDLWKLQGVSLTPTTAFTEIGQKPTWLLPILGAALLRLASVYTFYYPSRTPVAVGLTFLIEGVIPVLLPVVVCSGTFLFGVFMVGGRVTFRRVFSVLAHTHFFYTLVVVILSMVVHLLIPDGGQRDVASNLGFLVDSREHLALNYLVGSLDIITFYHLYLISLGLSIVAREVSFKASSIMVTVIWAAYVALGVLIKIMVS